jgi:hypothetical protein
MFAVLYQKKLSCISFLIVSLQWSVGALWALSFIILLILLTQSPLFRVQLGVPFSMEIIISMSWAIWSVRNDAIFRNVQPQISNAKRHFRKDFAQVILRAKKPYVPSISQWLEACV